MSPPKATVDKLSRSGRVQGDFSKPALGSSRLATRNEEKGKEVSTSWPRAARVSHQEWQGGPVVAEEPKGHTGPVRSKEEMRIPPKSFKGPFF